VSPFEPIEHRVQIDQKTGNVILGTGNPYNGVVIPGLSKFPSSATGRVAAATSPVCDGSSCNSLFAPSLGKSYVNVTNLFQPRVGIAYQLNAKTVLRAGGGRFVTRMGLLDNIFPGGMMMMMLVDSREFVIDESN